MTEVQAVVVGLDGEYAIVRAEQQGGCGRCHEPGGCGGNNLVQMMCGTKQEYRALNPGAANIGDQVVVVVGDGAISKAALLMYVWPLVFLFAGAVSGGLFLSSNLGAVLGGIVGLALSWPFVARLQLRVAKEKQFQPTILVRY